MLFAAQAMRKIHAQGSNAHHATAAVAVVRGASDFAAAGLQSGQAGGSGSAAAEKSFLLEEPAYFCACGGKQAGIFLGHQPAAVGCGGGAEEVRIAALESGGDMRGEHGFSSEERHLSVVGNGAQFSVGRRVVSDSLLAVGADDFVEVQK